MSQKLTVYDFYHEVEPHLISKFPRYEKAIKAFFIPTMSACLESSKEGEYIYLLDITKSYDEIDKFVWLQEPTKSLIKSLLKELDTGYTDNGMILLEVDLKIHINSLKRLKEYVGYDTCAYFKGRHCVDDFPRCFDCGHGHSKNVSALGCGNKLDTDW